MKKSKVLGACIGFILAFMLMACEDDMSGPCIQVEGPLTTKSYELNDFHSVVLEGVGSILLTQGSPQSVRIETQQTILDVLVLTVSNSTLIVSMNGCLEGQVDKLDIFVTIPDIRHLQLDGVGNIVAQNDFEVDELDIVINGVGDITLRGHAQYLQVNSSGVGNLNSFNLDADICTLVMTGIGNAEVTVNETLNVTISGNGNVYYKGMPTISTTISGNGSLTDAN